MDAGVADRDRAAFYRAVLVALRFVEGRKPTNRRFGAEADARWGALRGDLTTADRMDLLIRDANAEWPGAVGARVVFDLRATAEDEAFGPTWQPLEPVDAEELWRDVLAQPEPASIEKALGVCARCWGLELKPFAPPAVGAADKLLVCGPSAIAATVVAFGRGTDLDWSDQVWCVATPPAHRQLAALAGPLLNVGKAGRIVAADEELPAEAMLRVVVSDDADPGDADAIARLREAGGR